ncbi:MAG: hypothetical protein FJ116_10650 [Deltaproteobacteria bacterium]|nr:hypothetical protein [Deltaproteobacteria bacterium]
MQLKCECGEQFSPFLAPTEDSHLSQNFQLMSMGQQNPLDHQSSLQPFEGKNDVAPSSPSDYSESESAFAELRNCKNDVAPSSPSDYSESESAFAELRNFGEALSSLGDSNTQIPSQPDNIAPKTTAPPTLVSPMPSIEVATIQPPPGNSECMITAGELFSGFHIETFLEPVSVWSPTTLDSEDPLRQGHQVLAQRALQMGANGVVSVRWSFTPDGSRILLTGTPVKCRKN